MSPGVPAKLPALELARARGIPVWSEIELAWRFLRGKLVGDHGIERQDDNDFARGAHFEDGGDSDARRRKHRHAAAVAGGNVDGFERDGGGDQQFSARDDRGVSSRDRRTAESDAGPSRPARVVRRVCRGENADVRKSTGARRRGAERGRSRSDAANAFAAAHFWFSRQKRVAQGAFLRDGQIIFRTEGSEIALARRDEISLRGEHNVENVLAACAAAYLAGATRRPLRAE